MIYSRIAVLAAYEQACDLYPTEDAAVEAVATELGLAPEAVREALRAVEA